MNFNIIIIQRLCIIKIDGKICSPIKVQISKERPILKLAFWQNFFGTEPTDTSAFECHVVSLSLLLKIVLRPQNLVATSLAHIEGGVTRDQGETVAPQPLEA